MKIQNWLKQASEQLQLAEITSARLDCLVLIENVLGKSRSWVLAHDDHELMSTELSSLSKKLEQRKSHTPLAYVIGSKEFYGREFLVNKDVLIPRPESEDMISLLKEVLDLAQLSPAQYSLGTVLDIGTGSGILAVTAQLELPAATVIATDISESALKLAGENAARLKAPVQFYEANLLDLPSAIKPDLILANLPYVPEHLVTSEEITKEPKLALFSGSDGLDHYRMFWSQLVNLPHKPKVIIIESLESQHTDLTQLASNAGYALEKTATLVQLFVQNK